MIAISTISKHDTDYFFVWTNLEEKPSCLDQVNADAACNVFHKETSFITLAGTRVFTK